MALIKSISSPVDVLGFVAILLSRPDVCDGILIAGPRSAAGLRAKQEEQGHSLCHLPLVFRDGVGDPLTG